MLRKSKKRKVHRFYRKRKKRKSSKVLEASIILVAFLILIYGFSFFKKVSQSEETPGSSQDEELVFVRTQILNGCQKEGLAQRWSEGLRGLRVSNIVYDVIEIGNFEHSKTEQSFILDRTAREKEASPSKMAFLTARALGIDKENVLCKELKDNYQEIELTIVIGGDHERLFNPER
jgi:hypothetical protein